jgi:hypothetical protein
LPGHKGQEERKAGTGVLACLLTKSRGLLPPLFCHYHPFFSSNVLPYFRHRLNTHSFSSTLLPLDNTFSLHVLPGIVAVFSLRYNPRDYTASISPYSGGEEGNMQILVLLVFLIAWLLTFWLGTIALETTGLERSKARFQALSALAGAGFTTSESESIVNHPRRRRIAAWLIFIGNAGIIAFIIILILYLRAGLLTPTFPHIIIVILPLLLIILFVRFGILDKLSTTIIHSLQKRSSTTCLPLDELLLQTGEYGIVRLTVKWHESMQNFRLKDYALPGSEIRVLAIERGNTVFSFPGENELLLEGDRLLCYGKLI